MYKMASALLVFSSISFMSFMGDKTSGRAEDHFNAGSLRFADKEYNVVWSNASETACLQEYLPAGQTVDKFDKMLVIEIDLMAVTPAEEVAAMARELDERKGLDKWLSYNVTEVPETGEYLIDFVTSQGDYATPGIVSWNVYRYSAYTTPDGKEGVRLFGYTERAYGKKTKLFLSTMSARKDAEFERVKQFDLSEVRWEK